MLFLRESEIRRLLSMKEAIRVTREVFEGLASGNSRNQARRRLMIESGSVLHSMAGAHGSYFGAKVYTTHVRHGAHFLFLLCDAATARPLSLMEANSLGQIRTGAASGVATDLLARPDAQCLAVIGSGFQARSQLEAVAAVRDLREVRVWSRTPEHRDQFAAESAGRGSLPVRAASSAREAAEGADIVTTATFSRDPVIEDDWIQAGCHVNAIGSNNPLHREIPGELVRRANLIAVDSLEQARLESGDLLAVLDPDRWSELPLVELAAVVAGTTGRGSPHDVTIFKSNGLGVEDVAAAAYVYERALESGAGDQVDWFYS